jgi:hypothetical protein
VSEPNPRGSPVKGMTFGILVDLVGSTVAGFLLMFAWGVWLAASGANAEQIEQAVQNVDPMSGIALLGYVVGAGFSCLGGYVAARVARETELRCAAVVALVSCSVGVALAWEFPFWLNLLLVVLTAASVMLGGWMGAQRNAYA